VLQVFNAAFRGYDLRELSSDSVLSKLTRIIWQDRKVSVSVFVLRVSSSSLRVTAASRRLSLYPAGGVIFGLLGARGLATPGGRFRLFSDRSDQVVMSACLVGLGAVLTLGASRRPVLHVDFDGGRIHAGSLNLWEVDKPQTALRVAAATPGGGHLSTPRGLMCLLNWLDAVNADEQWTQYGAVTACALIASIPAVEKIERWSKGLSSPVALTLQAAVMGLFYGGALRMGNALRVWLVDPINERPPLLDPTRAPRYGPHLPRQCRASDFEPMAKASRS